MGAKVQFEAQGVQMGGQAAGLAWGPFPPHAIGAPGQWGGCSLSGHSASLSTHFSL